MFLLCSRKRTAMPLYRFHCTDGTHTVFDGVGRLATRAAGIEAAAAAVARGVTADSPDERSWAGWVVSVHDLRGRRLAVLPFEHLQRAPSGAGRHRHADRGRSAGRLAA
jgi:hypothetical protein